MNNAPLMPMATAIWLVENTTLTFRQIAEFCNLHEVEIQGIADGEVAKGIKPYNPIISGQLTKKEIELGSLTPLRDLNFVSDTVHGFLHLAESEFKNGEIFNVSTGKQISIGDLAGLIKNKLNRFQVVNRHNHISLRFACVINKILLK